MKTAITAVILLCIAGVVAVMTLAAKKEPTQKKLLAAAVSWLLMLAYAAVWAVIAFFG